MNRNVLGRTMVRVVRLWNCEFSPAHRALDKVRKKELEMDGEQNGILHNWMDVECFRNETHFDTKKKKKESCR
jgi:hypothetical protein